MKILQVGKFYPIRGGVEKVMYDLMEGLSLEGVHCDMLCASTEDFPAGEVVLNDFAKVIVVATKVKAAATMLAPGMIPALRSIARNYDIIHIHHPDPMAALALFLSGYRGKVVLHWHSDIVKQKRLLQLYKPLQSWLIRRADLIVGTTPVYVQESPFLQQVQQKIDYIPIGVEPLQAEETAVQRIRARYGGRKIIFSLGRLVEYKGYEYLIRSAEFLSEEYVIVIGGKGPLKASLEALIDELGVRDKVFLVDFISDEDLPNYFGACAIFCLSSIMKTEAFAIVQIEAMSLGKPIVSTHIPGSGVSWVNKEGVSGTVVDKEDGKALAEGITRLLEDAALYEARAEGAKRRYQTEFTRTSMIEKCFDLYRKLLS